MSVTHCDGNLCYSTQTSFFVPARHVPRHVCILSPTPKEVCLYREERHNQVLIQAGNYTKAARLHEYDEQMNVELQLEEVPTPEITAPDDVIVRIGAAGLCRTDLHIIEGVWKDIQDPNRTLLPYTLGHENAGWVEEVGPGVKGIQRGDAVICHPLRTCGVCYGCRWGEDMYCERAKFPGLNCDGGFADYLLTNERALIKLNPNVVPIDVALLADAGITAYRVAKRAAKT